MDSIHPSIQLNIQYVFGQVLIVFWYRNYLIYQFFSREIELIIEKGMMLWQTWNLFLWKMIWGCCKAITFSTEAVLQRCDVRILWPFDFWHAIASSESYSAVEEPVPTLFNESASTKDLYKINSSFSFSPFSLEGHKLHYESGLKITSQKSELVQLQV